MTGEYFPACVVAIADVLVISLVVLGTRLSNSELTGVPHRLVTFIITVSSIVAVLVFLGICLDACRLAKYHIYDPQTAGQHTLDVGQEPFSRLHRVGDR